MYLLDTNVLSELRRPDRADANVRSWASAHPAALFYISAVTVLEIELGVLSMERRDARQGAVLRAWFEQSVMAPFADRVMAIDAAVARRCASLQVPDPRPERDALLAATALTHGMTVVTRDASDFEALGAAVLNPWTSGAANA
jgi:predicted nucleic acid-binding protein